MLGFPPGTLTGISGLELGFNDRLSGKPGGQLLATSSGAGAGGGTGGAGGTGERVLAQSEPERGKAVRTNIDPDLQDSTVAALGGTYGGVAVLDAKKGSVLALAGLAYSAPQPPGSTFKIITATGALEDGIVKPSDEFPVESSNSDIGREIPNAHDELCGGSFATSFADSCNTVFAPLGAELGGEKLVKTAELYGFNAPPTLFDQATTALIDPPQSTIPKDLSESVETGESAIGQGEVLATPLEMAAVSQTVANGGVRLPNAIARDPELQPPDDQVKVSSPETAATMRQLMIGVVNDGTGIAAAAARNPGRRQDRDRRAWPERPGARPGTGAGRGGAAGHRRLVHGLRPGQQAQDRRRGDGRQRRRGRRHRGGTDRAPGHGLLLRRLVARGQPSGKPIVAPMITSAEPAIAMTPAAVSAGSETSATAKPATASSAPAPTSSHQPPPRRLRSGSVSQAPAPITARQMTRAPVESSPPITTTAATAVRISVSCSVRVDIARTTG